MGQQTADIPERFLAEEVGSRRIIKQIFSCLDQLLMEMHAAASFTK